MRTEKRYWIWDAKYYETEFQLGKNINEFIDKGLVKRKEDEPSKYSGVYDNPWSIGIENNIINYLFYRETFFSLFGDKSIWDLPYEEFEKKADKYLKKTNLEYTGGDIFYTVFRGSFIAVAALIRKK